MLALSKFKTIHIEYIILPMAPRINKNHIFKLPKYYEQFCSKEHPKRPIYTTERAGLFDMHMNLHPERWGSQNYTFTLVSTQFGPVIFTGYSVEKPPTRNKTKINQKRLFLVEF